MREGRRRGSRGVGRVRPGPLGVTVGAIVVIVVGLIVGVRPRHVISRKRGEVSSRAVHIVAEVGVMPRVVVVGRSSESLALDLSRRLGEDRDITTAVVVVHS